jgi:hypothetical protein
VLAGSVHPIVRRPIGPRQGVDQSSLSSAVPRAKGDIERPQQKKRGKRSIFRNSTWISP